MESSTPAPTSGSKPGDKSKQILTEIPSSLRTLARLVVRGFHSIEDALIVDMLVRYPCMREDDISGLLKFDKKNLRSRMAMLKNDKFVQVRFIIRVLPKYKSGDRLPKKRVTFYSITFILGKTTD